MLPPGAAMDGLKNKSFVGPKVLKIEVRPPVGLSRLIEAPVCGNVTRTGRPALTSPTRYLPSSCWMIAAGVPQMHQCWQGDEADD